MYKKMILLLCIITSFSAAALASPTVSGPTGLINTPSSEVISENKISLGYYQQQSNNVKIVNIGILPNTELGVSQHHYEQSSSDTYLNIKYNILKENLLAPGISVGIEDLTACSQRSSYIVMSKELPLGLKINVGMGNGRFDGAFAGVEATFSLLPLLPVGDGFFPTSTLIAEHDGHTTNLGLRVSVVPGVKVEMGRSEHKYYWGANFTI